MGKVWPPETRGCRGCRWQLGPTLFSRFSEVLPNKKESEILRHQSPGRVSTTGMCLLDSWWTDFERACEPSDGNVESHLIDLRYWLGVPPSLSEDSSSAGID